MKFDINVKFKAKRKYIVNGKEYGSIEEMPADIRRIYEKAAGSLETNRGASLENAKKKIVFNGQEYENVEALPPEVRSMYDEVIKMAEIKGVSPGTVVGKLISCDPSEPIAPEPVMPPRVLTVAVLLIAFLGLLYFLYRKGHGH